MSLRILSLLPALVRLLAQHCVRFLAQHCVRLLAQHCVYFISIVFRREVIPFFFCCFFSKRLSRQTRDITIRTLSLEHRRNDHGPYFNTSLGGERVQIGAIRRYSIISALNIDSRLLSLALMSDSEHASKTPNQTKPPR